MVVVNASAPVQWGSLQRSKSHRASPSTSNISKFNSSDNLSQHRRVSVLEPVLPAKKLRFGACVMRKAYGSIHTFPTPHLGLCGVWPCVLKKLLLMER